MQHFVGYAFDSDFAAGGNDSDVRFRFNARISPADLRQARALTVRSPHRPQPSPSAAHGAARAVCLRGRARARDTPRERSRDGASGCRGGLRVAGRERSGQTLKDEVGAHRVGCTLG